MQLRYAGRWKPLKPRVALIGCGAIASAAHLRIPARSRRARLSSPPIRHRCSRASEAHRRRRRDGRRAGGDRSTTSPRSSSAPDQPARRSPSPWSRPTSTSTSRSHSSRVAEGSNSWRRASAAGVIAAIGFNPGTDHCCASARARRRGHDRQVVAGQAIFCERCSCCDSRVETSGRERRWRPARTRHAPCRSRAVAHGARVARDCALAFSRGKQRRTRRACTCGPPAT